ncbi:TPA_asm: P3 [Tagetes erecta virus 1]|uniref:P3 n=1 Tax=Tagetes erecta virus 1 TaxID=2793742 RepID=A0A8D9PGX3_9RHAB|nr:P3 [Tagetes erecta virus 1]DAF42348.1 TPA_asm: P3 [Tagetes erecta virus 1]
MNKITLSPKSSMVMGLYVRQHNSEKHLKFPWVLSNIFKDKKYARIDSIFLKFTSLLKSEDYGKITVTVIDTRKQSQANNKVIEVEIRSNLDTEISIGNLEWADRHADCPYLLRVSQDIKGIKSDTKIGEIKIEPSFRYTNQQPDLVPLSLEIIPIIPNHLKGQYQMRTEKDENSVKFIRGKVERIPALGRRCYSLGGRTI